jgi:GTPase SAR1 family protein
MHIVTIVGNRYSGKSALCEQWTGAKFTQSYVTTLQLTRYHLPLMILHDTPSIERLIVDDCYVYSDLMVLMANEDNVPDNWYNDISSSYPTVPWILILNGAGHFKRRRRWALQMDIRVFQLDLSTDFNVSETLVKLREYLDELPSDSLELSNMTEYMFQFIPSTC